MLLKRFILSITLLLIGLMLCNTYSNAPDQPTLSNLFKPTITTTANDKFSLNLDIAPGYYLYQDKFQFKITRPNTLFLKPIQYPKAQQKTFSATDTYFVYENKVSIPLQLQQPAKNQRFSLTIQYQGCSEAGFCLAPQTTTTIIELKKPYNQTYFPELIATDSSSSFDTLHHLINQLNEQHTITTLLIFFGFGVLLSLTPCVLPMIPIVSSMIIGQKNTHKPRSFSISLSYVFGMACTYAIAGMMFGLVGATLQSVMQKPLTLIIFSLLFVLMAFSLFDFYTIELPSAIQKKIALMNKHQHKGTLLGAFIMGVLATLILSPCITPPLVAVLSYISHQGSISFGGLALFFMGLGLGLPLLVIGLIGKHALPKTGRWEIHLKHFMGFILLFIAIWIINRLIPHIVTTILYSLLLIAISCYMGAFNNAATPFKKITKYLGITLFIISIVFCSLGIYNWVNKKRDAVSTTNTSTNVTSIRQIQAFFDNPSQQGKPIIIDFYAHWCISCTEFEQTTLQDPEVQSLLSTHVAYLKVDISKNTTETQQLQQFYRVFAPPTLLFYNAKHQEIPKLRTTGLISTKEFIRNINTMQGYFIPSYPSNMDPIPEKIRKKPL